MANGMTAEGCCIKQNSGGNGYVDEMFFCFGNAAAKDGIDKQAYK